MEQKKNLILNNKDYSIIQADFFDNDFIIEPEYYNCRIDKGGQRFYVRYFDDENYIKAPSFSEIMNRVLGVNYQLSEWKAALGKEQAEFESKNSADYGTFLHVLFAEIIRGKSVVLDENWFFNEIEMFGELNDFDIVQLKKWYKLKKRKIIDDVVGFICWLKDYKVRPIAMEFPLMHPDGLWAGTADLICKIEVTEGRGKKEVTRDIIAMVDFKSTLNDFYESNEIQLHAYKELWNMEFSNLQIERVYNYGCNNFQRKSLKKYLSGQKTGVFRPYRFKDQTESEHIYKWDHYVKLYHLNPANLEFSNRFDYDPIISIDKDSDLSEIIQEYNVFEGLINDLKDETKISENKEIQNMAEKLAEDFKEEKNEK